MPQVRCSSDELLVVRIPVAHGKQQDERMSEKVERPVQRQPVDTERFPGLGLGAAASCRDRQPGHLLALRDGPQQVLAGVQPRAGVDPEICGIEPALQADRKRYVGRELLRDVIGLNHDARRDLDEQHRTQAVRRHLGVRRHRGHAVTLHWVRTVIPSSAGLLDPKARPRFLRQK